MFDWVLNKVLFPLYGIVDIFREDPLNFELIENARYNLFFFHGNSAVVSETTELSSVLKDHCNIIQIEYPGYYKNNKPIPLFDAKDFMDQMEKQFIKAVDVLPDLPIVLVGQSIGTVVAGALAKRQPDLIDKMILITPLARVGADLFSPNDLKRFLFNVVNEIDEFDNVKMLQLTDFPVLLITAVNDEILAGNNSDVLMRVREGVKNFNIVAGHNNINFNYYKLQDELIDFLF